MVRMATMPARMSTLVNGGRDRNGTDDVSGHQHLQPEQDGAADILPKAAEGIDVRICR